MVVVVAALGREEMEGFGSGGKGGKEPISAKSPQSQPLKQYLWSRTTPLWAVPGCLAAASRLV